MTPQQIDFAEKASKLDAQRLKSALMTYSQHLVWEDIESQLVTLDKIDALSNALRNNIENRLKK